MPIVVALSDSALGRTALDHAVEESRRRDLPLVLVAQVSMPRNNEAADAYHGRLEEAQAAVEAEAERLRADGLTVETSVPRAPTGAAQAVVDAATAHDADLVVVGIRRRSPVGKAILGSVAQDILLQADCPVLGVKLPQGSGEDEEE